MTSDPDYAAYFDAPPPVECTALRRALAMHQWLQARTDGEYHLALDAIRNTSQAEAWRVFRHRNGRSVVRTLRIRPGEAICDTPLCQTIDREQLARGQDWGHALVTALATVDIDATIASLQEHDPLSWRRAAWLAAPPGGPGPTAQRDVSPPVRRRPWPEEVPARAITALTVTFDTLEWPPRRSVTTHQSMARSRMSSTHKRRRQTSSQSR